MAHPTVAVLERHLLLYKHLWRSSVFTFFVLPALFLLSMGVGVGGYVSEVENGVDYLAWIAPALLALLAFQVAINESTMGVYTDFEWIGAFHVMRHTRVRIRDMILGWHLYVLVVVELSTGAFLLVTWAFGLLHTALAESAPFISALLAMSVAAPTTAFAATVRHTDHFHLLTQFGVIPATMVSGVFFPTDQLPMGLDRLAWLSPLWHGVELTRSAAVGVDTAWPTLAHVCYLVVWTGLGLCWAGIAFRRRLPN